MKRLRAFLYRQGYRPSPRSIFYSPSLHLFYTWRDLYADQFACFQKRKDD